MEAGSLFTSLNKVLEDVVKGPIVNEGKFMPDKLHKHRWDTPAIETYYLTSFRMRVEELVENIPTITVEPQEGEVMPLMDQEIQHCAAVIATAFLNPSKQN